MVDVEPGPEHAEKFVAVPVEFAVAASGTQPVAFAEVSSLLLDPVSPLASAAS